MTVTVRSDDAGAGRLTCDSCGATTPFDESLPYVQQAAGFSLEHACTVDLTEPA